MGRLGRVKELAAKLYSGTIRADSQYAFAVRQYRDTVLKGELERDPRLLTPYGWSGYSQNDEDGIIQEIFRRISASTRNFLEFGSGDPLRNAGTYLLLSGWSGEWIDASPGEIAQIRSMFRAWLASGNLTVTQAFITPENINAVIERATADLDLLVIDIDGNDFHVWQALKSRPRVIMIEYNATFRPPAAVVQSYTKEPFWNGGNFYGASLKAYEYLGREKGYQLVGCNFAGTNAFFVRDDLVGDRFSQPYTAEHHYREQWIDAMACGYGRQIRSAGPGIRYTVIPPKL